MPRIRTFLAIDLGAKMRGRLVALQEQLATEAPDVKWVEPENLHLTLFFLGEVDQREIIDICRAAQNAVADTPSFDLCIQGTGCFPNARRPHVLWAGVGDGSAEVCAIHDAIEAPLLDLGCYRREARAYTPHVTLGRVKSEGSHDALVQALTNQQAWSAGETAVREVCVMSSELTRDGPTYTVMGRAKLAK
jgi:RNA 2',3'-cyclic 3'-phosphodiesterase